MRFVFSYLSILFLIIFVLLINSNYEKKKRDLDETQNRNELYHIFVNNCIANSVISDADECYKSMSDFWHD